MTATISQLWPTLANDKLVRSQRRLFAEQRRRPAWVRVRRPDGVEIEAHIDDVQPDSLVIGCSAGLSRIFCQRQKNHQR
jgi:hypothetical protein